MLGSIRHKPSAARCVQWRISAGDFATMPGRDSPELLFDEAILLGCRCPRTFGESASQPRLALGCLAAFLLPRAFLVCRAHTGPRTQMLDRGKLAHVTPRLRLNSRCTSLLHPWHCLQLPFRLLQRAHKFCSKGNYDRGLHDGRFADVILLPQSCSRQATNQLMRSSSAKPLSPRGRSA